MLYISHILYSSTETVDYDYFLLLCLQFLTRQFMKDVQFCQITDNGGLTPVFQMVPHLKVSFSEH